MRAMHQLERSGVCKVSAAQLGALVHARACGACMRILSWNINGLRAIIKHRGFGTLPQLLTYLEAGAQRVLWLRLKCVA